MADKLNLTIREIFRSERGDRRYGWDDKHGMWVDVPRRQRPYYICSAGVEHRRWWLLHQPGSSYPIIKRCSEHEMNEIIAADIRLVDQP
jgi:hypothetical protein